MSNPIENIEDLILNIEDFKKYLDLITEAPAEELTLSSKVADRIGVSEYDPVDTIDFISTCIMDKFEIVTNLVTLSCEPHFQCVIYKLKGRDVEDCLKIFKITSNEKEALNQHFLIAKVISKNILKHYS